MHVHHVLRSAAAGIALVITALGPNAALAKPAAGPSIDALGVKLAAPVPGIVNADRSARGAPSASGGAPGGHRLGLRFAPAADLAKMPAARGGRAMRPAAANLLAYTPAIVNQGQQSSCVGFATTYAALTIMATVKSGQAQTPFSPAYTYNRGVVLDALASGETPDCGRGMMIETALSLLQGFGAQPLESFSYSDLECARIPGYYMDESARKFRISGWARAQTREDILQAIVRNTPVVIGMQIPETFMDYQGGIYADTASPGVGGHAMTIVGYDDNYQVYLVMNSWGPNWGDHGYAWVNYDALESRITMDTLLRAFILYP